MQAVILAAGLGSRLKKLTENNTKSMVEVNGISLMERMLRILDDKSLSNIIVVTGYKSEFFISLFIWKNFIFSVLYKNVVKLQWFWI